MCAYTHTPLLLVVAFSPAVPACHALPFQHGDRVYVLHMSCSVDSLCHLTSFRLILSEPNQNIHNTSQVLQYSNHEAKVAAQCCTSVDLWHTRWYPTFFWLWKPTCPISMPRVFFKLPNGVYTTDTLFILQPTNECMVC